jgi:hypothetical protein
MLSNSGYTVIAFEERLTFNTAQINTTTRCFYHLFCCNKEASCEGACKYGRLTPLSYFSCVCCSCRYSFISVSVILSSCTYFSCECIDCKAIALKQWIGKQYYCMCIAQRLYNSIRKKSPCANAATRTMHSVVDIIHS